MSEPHDSRSHNGSINELQCIIAQCRFETEWESGERPRAEDFVAHWPLQDQNALLPRLLAIEISFRRKAGDQPGRPELEARFPDRVRIVDEALGSPRTRSSVRSMPCEDDANPEAEGEPFPKFGRYRVVGRVGRGGFGIVYSAYDDTLHRMVAIKVPKEKRAAQREFADSYLTEARVLARLDHPNIVPVYDCGAADDGRPFVVSKFIEGRNLAERIAQGRPAFEATRAIIAAIADALHYAHLQGIVHRDVKPGNILLDSADRAFLADFGIVLREEEFGTGPTFAGTPAYMSPEQARYEGHRVDGRSDVFSLGVVLYQMLTGRRPFHGRTEEELLNELIEAEARPPRQIDDAIPRDLERICLKALSKRAADRYSTARDMADDLRHGEPPERPAIRESAASAIDPAAIQHILPLPASSAVSASTDRLPVRIVPKGLRSFDALDADFFLELLPGPRDRDGLPDSVRFWKTRIEETDPDETFSVGLIYGPSGCGKSSLIKAGLLPRLAPHVQPVYVEASAQETEARLLHNLRKRFPALAKDDLSLQETLAALRYGRGLSAGQKVVLVLDQFEQWLHAHGDRDNSSLALALRQCDGKRVQALLLVRDDFWMSISRWFDQLEIHLNQAHNARAQDLLDPDHARRVLRLFGEAYGRLPPKPEPLTPDQRTFLDRAVKELTGHEHVIPVRLSLFADLMKERPWTSSELVQCGGAEGVGVKFLHETFASRSALPELRVMEQPARRLLQSLLPERGADIKGRMRSREELAEAAGLTDHPQRFARLIELLDRELHILTPTEADRDAPASAGEDADAPPAFYQLTHDYLVASLRKWLTLERQKTWRGRAELCLEERTRQWSPGRERGFLPSAAEYASIALAVPARRRSPDQKALMRAASRHHGWRWGSSFIAIAAIALAVFYQQWEYRGKVIQDDVNALVESSAGKVADNIDKLRPYASRAKPILQARFDDETAVFSRRLNAAYGLAALGKVEQQFLMDAIPDAAADCKNILAALGPAKEQVAETLLSRSRNEKEPAAAARFAIVLLSFGDARACRSLAKLEADPSRRTALILALANWHGDLAPIDDVLRGCKDNALRGSQDAALCSALCAAVGLITPSGLGPSERASLQTTIADKFQFAVDAGTHSAAGWALRQLGVTEPPLPRSESRSPPTDRDWFVTEHGITMLRVKAGKFVMGNLKEPREAKPHEVTLTQSYFVSDRPITVGLYRRFLIDRGCDPSDKPTDWQTHSSLLSTELEYPVQWVNLHDAILFCNWLSAQARLDPCYVPTDIHRGADDAEGWHWHLDRCGFRLATEAEWEYACRAGTKTEYSFGDDESLLPKYGIAGPRPVGRAGSLFPNAWGLFDVHGNVSQWCWDRFGDFDAIPVIDPLGPRADDKLDEIYRRTMRGGHVGADAKSCTSSSRFNTAPVSRMNTCGIRVVLTVPPVPKP